MPRIAAWIAAGLVAASSGCATMQAGRARDKHLAAELDAVRHEKPLDDVWNAVRQLLADQGFPLAGADARAVGQDEGMLSRLVSAAVETHPDGTGGQILETGWSNGKRVRAEAKKTEAGWRVGFTAIAEDIMKPAREGYRSRDLDMELALTRRLAPETAARIEAGLEALARPR